MASPLESWENEGGALSPSAQKEARLAGLFKDVNPPEITSLDLRGKGPQEVFRLLPPYGGENPVYGILIDNQPGKAYGLRSGWKEERSEVGGITFGKGNLRLEVAERAGTTWRLLGAHVEAQSAALMRRAGITDAMLCINASNPCYLNGIGCFYRLPGLLAEGSSLQVYNKHGRLFPFRGAPDE
jgi:hypothetical protein